jgi:hypothetical protein
MCDDCKYFPISFMLTDDNIDCPICMEEKYLNVNDPIFQQISHLLGLEPQDLLSRVKKRRKYLNEL